MAKILESYTVVDRYIFTGQNPASSGPLAKKLVEALSRPEAELGAGCQLPSTGDKS